MHRDVINGPNDITFMPTPVTISGGYPRKEWTVYRQEALLYTAAADGGRGRLATIWLSNVYGYVFREIGRLRVVEVREADCGSRWATTHQIRFGIVPPGKRTGHFYDRDFPIDCVLIAWGTWNDVDLKRPVGPPVLSRDPAAYRRHWEDVRDTVNCAAGSAVWLDTTTAAIEANDARCAARERNVEQQTEPGLIDNGDPVRSE